MRQTPGGQKVPVKIAGGSDFGRYQKISSAKTYNMFINKVAKTEEQWIVNTAGYNRVYNLLAQGQGRGSFTSIRGGFLLCVVNSFVYSLDVNLNPTFIGNLATEIGEVFIDENLNSQICIVDGLNAYIYNYSMPPNLTVQTGLGTLIPGYVEFHNTFFLFGNNDTNSANGSFWYAYQFSTATTIVEVPNGAGQFALQTKPDYALAVLRIPGQGSNVLVLGSSVGEVWTQIGGLQNYRKNSTISIDYGCVSTSTIAKSDKYIAWVGENENNSPVIMVYTGQGAAPLSDSDGIDYEIANIQFPEQSTAMFYRQDGHLFYQLTFFNPADNITYLYDFTTQEFFYLTDFLMNYHPAREYSLFNGTQYFLSLNNCALYETSTNITVYNENLPVMDPDPTLILEIPRVRITDTWKEADSAQRRINSFGFTIEQGNDEAVTGASLLNGQNLLITEHLFVPPDDVIYTEYGIPIGDEQSPGGSAPGQPADIPPYRPRVDLSISKDGGITWSNTVSRGLNPVAIRQNILNWEGFGAANYLTVKLRFWGMSRFVCTDGFMEIY